MPRTEAGKPVCIHGHAYGLHPADEQPDCDAFAPVGEHAAEAVAAERERIRAAVEGLRVKTKGEPQDNGWQRGYRDSRNDTVAAVLAIIDPEAEG